MKNNWEIEREALKNRKIVLAFDTSVTGCAICISDGKNSWRENLATERGQAEFLVPMINDLIRKSGYSYNCFDRIAVTVGPGSFTGVRVGLSTAKGLALSLNRPLIGFATLSVIARGSNLKENTLVAIDTKRGDYYGQIFGAGGEAKTDADIWTQKMIDETSLPVIKDVVPDVEVLAQMALEWTGSDIHYDPDRAPSPVYLRGAEVSQSKRVTPKIVGNGN